MGLKETMQYQKQMKYIKKIREWCDQHWDEWIQVEVVTDPGGGKLQHSTHPPGKILAIEEHPREKGLHRIVLNTPCYEGDDTQVLLGAGYEICGVSPKRNTLIIERSPNGYFEMTAGVKPPKYQVPLKVDWPQIPGYTLVTCDHCHGYGGEDQQCPWCKGAGQLLAREPAHKCGRCNGEGSIIRDNIYSDICPVCNGRCWYDALWYTEAAAMTGEDGK